MKIPLITVVKQEDGSMFVVDTQEIEIPDPVKTPIEKLVAILELKGYLKASDVKDMGL